MALEETRSAILNYFEFYCKTNKKDYKAFEKHLSVILKDNFYTEDKTVENNQVVKSKPKKKRKKQETEIHVVKSKEELEQYPSTQDLNEWEEFLEKENLICKNSSVNTDMVDAAFADL